jgi:hypothetical protein
MKDSQTKTLEKIYTSYFKGGLPISPYVTLNLIDIDFKKTSDPRFKTQFIFTGTFDVNIDKDIIATDYYSIDDATNFHIKDIWNDKKAGIPVDAFNHCIDPSRYCVSWILKPKFATTIKKNSLI